MIERRGLIGVFLAAPFIVRTPGLLMPIKMQRIQLTGEAVAICGIMGVKDWNKVREISDERGGGKLVLSDSDFAFGMEKTKILFSRTVAEPALKGFLAEIASFQIYSDSEFV